MTKLEIFDPAMCCSTGVCGPSVDKKLVQFAADVDWLKKQKVVVERFNLSQQPADFVKNPAVKQALDKDGDKCLPLILMNGREVCRGRYPIRKELADLLGISIGEAASLYTPAVAELVAIAASISANCKPCLKYHYDKALSLGVSIEDIARAVETAQMVKDTAAGQMSDFANRYNGTAEPAPTQSCCGPDKSGPSRSGCC